MAGPRRFDHDEARALYATGSFTIAELARRFGVTPGGMGFVVSERQRAYYRAEIDSGARSEWLRRRCRRPCVRGCGRLAWHHQGREGVCRVCRGLERATTVKPDALLCARCGKWKPDHAFPSRASAKARRGRHAYCRPCQTAARRDYRERHKQPCNRCGKPRLSNAEQAASARYRGTLATGLCRECFLDTQRKPEPGSEAVQATKGTDRSAC